MGNFIGLVYATLKNEGIDTKGMSTDEAVKKYNELQEKSGGKAGEKEGTPAENRKLQEKGILDEKQLKLIPKMKTEHLKESIEWFEGLYEKHKDKESGEQIKRFIDAYKEELNKRKTVEQEINYDTVKYPQGTSKEYTMQVNDKYEKALPIIEKLGISVKDFGGKQSKEGGFEDNTEEIMQKYVFEPFNKKYPKGNNEAWSREFQPIYDAIEAVGDKNYNDWWIKNK